MEKERDNYDELCRLCASYDAVKMDIFGQEGKNRQLVDKIQTCLPFKIAEDDRLPKCLCYRCMYNLENYYDFRNACINAVSLLERCLPTNNEQQQKKPCQGEGEGYSQLRMELLKDKEPTPNFIAETPIVNPNAALGTPPRLKSDFGEPDHEMDDRLEQDANLDDIDERKSDEYEMDMETNPSDFLEMTSMLPGEEAEQIGPGSLRHRNGAVFPHRNEQHEVYVCSLCNKAFSSKGHLSLHARIHVGAGDVIGEKVITDDHTSYKRPYQCDLCNKSYSTAKHRWGHVSTTHRGHPAVTCAYCSRIYSTRTNLDEHVKSRHAGMPPPPEVPYPVKQEPLRHQCKTCPKMYTSITDLNKHIKKCGGQHRKDILNNAHVKNLVDNISDMSSIDSDYDSNKDYKNAEAKLAKNPQLTILKQALIKGESAKKEYEERQKMLEKAKKQSAGEEIDAKNWYCDACPLNFATEEELYEHEETHDSTKPYICVLCEKDFALKSSLSRHILTYHGVDPSPIIDTDRCLKKSAHQSTDTQIKLEEDLSKDESPFSSENHDNEDEDPENDIDNGDMETVFVCEICTRDFNDRASLWLHIRATHKEFAAFACGICLKICQDNEQLLNHVNMYHGGSKLLISEQRRYSCTICGRQHDSRKKLITHVSIHNIDPQQDPANYVQLNTNFYNENINSNEGNDLIMDCDVDENEKVDCYICNKPFPNEDQLIRHQRNAHKQEPILNETGNGIPNQNGNSSRAQFHLFFVCELCGSSHPSKWERWLHVNSEHSNELSIKCDKEECGKIFATKSLRTEHAQHHVLQGPSPNTCEICGKLWGSRVDYWKHVMGVHSDTVPLICGVCLKVFPNVYQLSNHVKMKHWPLNNGDFSCDICGRPYSNKSKMSRHRKIHGLDDEAYPLAERTAESPLEELIESVYPSNHEPQLVVESELTVDSSQMDLSCEMCGGIKFASLEDLGNHRRMAHGLFPCDLCNKCYGRTSHLWKHVNRVHKGHKDVTCRFCLKTSASRDHLAAHIAKIHRYEPEIKNEMMVMNSGVSSNDSTMLERYKTSSTSLMPSPGVGPPEEDGVLHFCEKCNKSFHKRYLLRRHMKGCQNYRKDPGALLTRCRACERIFKDRASLQKHLENHHSSYECHLCKESITSKLGIMTHNRVHHMNHPDLTCELESCRKLFRTKEDLEQHRNYHKYGTPNVCDFCGDTVENKLKLKMHILSLHRNEIGVSCGVCLIPMKDPKDLKKHVEDVHASVLTKPNTCQVCGKKYASKWKAFDHTKKCHGKVFLTCKQCLAVFTSDEELRNHYEFVHKVPKDQLDTYQYRLEVNSKTEDGYDSLEVVVKEEPEDLDFDMDDAYDDDDFNETGKKRSIMDTFDCEICHEIFLNHDNLANHYKNVHNTDPSKMFKKAKLESSTSPTSKLKKKMRDRENYECKNCQKQFCTKTLFWSHVNTCTRRSSSAPTSILEAHLKNNNQFKPEVDSQPQLQQLAQSDSMLAETNLNIPDFNLFEDINMQLSGQKQVPSLMPLANKSSKYSRKDSRKVYDETTNTECTCEVCGKPWPAKKHLWQHLIRFHRAEAAVTCGVCLKLCSSYADLADHLKSTHPAILSTVGNNFTCKICGRYHNARSKLFLHMSIHINCDSNLMCQKCHRTFEGEEQLKDHVTTCLTSPEEDNENTTGKNNDDDDDEKGSLIGDEEPQAAEYESEDASENSHSSSSNSSDSESDSDSSSSSDDDDGVSRNSESASCNSDSKESNNSNEVRGGIDIKEEIVQDNMSMEQNSMQRKSGRYVATESEDEHYLEKKPNIRHYTLQDKKVLMNYSDDEGPPLLSPMMPSVIKRENDHTDSQRDIHNRLNNMNSLNSQASLRDRENLRIKDHLSTEDEDEDDDIMGESEDENVTQVVDPNRPFHEDNSQSTYETVEQERELEETEEITGQEIPPIEPENEQIVEDAINEEEVLEMDENDLQNLNGTVLMLANDEDGNQILIERNMADLGPGDVQDMTEYVFQDGNGYALEGYEQIVEGQHEVPDFNEMKMMQHLNEANEQLSRDEYGLQEQEIMEETVEEQMLES